MEWKRTEQADPRIVYVCPNGHKEVLPEGVEPPAECEECAREDRQSRGLAFWRDRLIVATVREVAIDVDASCWYEDGRETRSVELVGLTIVGRDGKVYACKLENGYDGDSATLELRAVEPFKTDPRD